MLHFLPFRRYRADRLRGQMSKMLRRERIFGELAEAVEWSCRLCME